MQSSPQIDDLVQRLARQAGEHAIVLLSPTGQIVAWLGAAELVFGYTAAEAIGRPITDLFTPEDKAKGMPQHEMDVAVRGSHAEDDRWMLRKGGRFWAAGALVPIRGESGELLGFGKIVRNRTDMKGQLESAHQLSTKLQTADEHKNTFIATLAHELRNPLSSIASSLAILDLVGSQSEDARFARATIKRQLDHMKRMIEDLLDVTRARTGKVQLHLSETELNAIVAAAVETCRGAIDQRTHAFEVVRPEAPIIVKADADRLQQVFVNLIQNALKYTEYGGNICVKVSVEGSEAVVRVEDTGVGISGEMLPRIFDLFTQAEFATEREDAGLGIGLSVVKDLTALHGGTVQVKSDGIGKGSEFTVRLPLAGADAKRLDRPEPR